MKSLMFAAVAVVAVILGSANAAQAQHYDQQRQSYGYEHSGYNNPGYGRQPDRHYQPSHSHRPSYGHGHVDYHAPVYSPPVHVHRPQYPIYQAPPVCLPVPRYPSHGRHSSHW